MGGLEILSMSRKVTFNVFKWEASHMYTLLFLSKSLVWVDKLLSTCSNGRPPICILGCQNQCSAKIRVVVFTARSVPYATIFTSSWWKISKNFFSYFTLRNMQICWICINVIIMLEFWNTRQSTRDVKLGRETWKIWGSNVFRGWKTS